MLSEQPSGSGSLLTRLLLCGIAACALLLSATPFVVSPQTIYPTLVGKTLYARSLIEIMAALWVILALVSPRHRPRWSWVMAAFAGYVVVAWLAGWAGVSPSRSMWSTFPRMMGVWGLAHWFLLALVLSSVLRTCRAWWWLLNGFLLSALSLEVAGVAQSLGVHLLPYQGAGARLSITLGNPSYLAAILVLTTPLAAGFLAQSFTPQGDDGERPEERRWRTCWRVFWAATIVLGVWVLFLTGTRAAVLGLASGAVFMPLAVLARGHPAALRPVAVSGIGLVVLLGSFFLIDRTIGLPTGSPERDGTAAQRFFPQPTQGTGASGVYLHLKDSMVSRGRSALYGLRAFAHRPLLGWGPENYLPAFESTLDPEYFRTTDEFFDQAHNLVIEELATKGLLGGLAFCALWGTLLWAIVRRRRSCRQEILAYGVLAALAAYLIQAQFLFDTPAAMLFLTVLIGWVAAQESREVEADGMVQPVRRAPSHSRRLWAVYLASSAGIAALLAMSLYAFNLRPYRAAAEAKAPLTGRVLEARSLERARRSFAEFPPLANEPRSLLFQRLGQEWPDLGPESRSYAFRLALEEINRGVQQEPENSRFLLSAVLFLQSTASNQDDLARIDVLLDRLTSAAPRRVQVHQFAAVQALLRGDRQEAIRISEAYARDAPWTQSYFAEILAFAGS